MLDININTPKKKAIALGVLMFVCLSGFAVGKFNSKPNKTFEEHQRVQTQTQTQAQVDTQVQKQQSIDAQKDVNKDVVKDTDTKTTTTTVKRANGEVVTKTTTETKTHVDNRTQAQQDVKTATQNSANQEKSVNQTQTQVVKTDIRSTETYAQANWRLSIFGGGDFQGLNFSKGMSLPVEPFYGGEVDRRILGPFWLGVMGMKLGPGVGAGLSVSMQF